MMYKGDAKFCVARMILSGFVGLLNWLGLKPNYTGTGTLLGMITTLRFYRFEGF